MFFFRIFWGVSLFLGGLVFSEGDVFLPRWSSGVDSRGSDDHAHMKLLVILTRLFCTDDAGIRCQDNTCQGGVSEIERSRTAVFY